MFTLTIKDTIALVVVVVVVVVVATSSLFVVEGLVSHVHAMKDVLGWTAGDWSSSSSSSSTTTTTFGSSRYLVGWWCDHALFARQVKVSVVGRVQVLGPGQSHVIGKGATTKDATVAAVPTARIEEL